MNESIRDILETQHNVYIDPETDQYNLHSYDEPYGWQPIPAEWITCSHCGGHEISDDPEIAEQGLCDSCYREVNDYEIVGWRKGE